jgi:hypothetical protein
MWTQHLSHSLEEDIISMPHKQPNNTKRLTVNPYTGLPASANPAFLGGVAIVISNSSN